MAQLPKDTDTASAELNADEAAYNRRIKKLISNAVNAASRANLIKPKATPAQESADRTDLHQALSQDLSALAQKVSLMQQKLNGGLKQELKPDISYAELQHSLRADLKLIANPNLLQQAALNVLKQLSLRPNHLEDFLNFAAAPLNFNSAYARHYALLCAMLLTRDLVRNNQAAQVPPHLPAEILYAQGSSILEQNTLQSLKLQLSSQLAQLRDPKLDALPLPGNCGTVKWPDEHTLALTLSTDKGTLKAQLRLQETCDIDLKLVISSIPLLHAFCLKLPHLKDAFADRSLHLKLQQLRLGVLPAGIQPAAVLPALMPAAQLKLEAFAESLKQWAAIPQKIADPLPVNLSAAAAALYDFAFQELKL